MLERRDALAGVWVPQDDRRLGADPHLARKHARTQHVVVRRNLANVRETLGVPTHDLQVGRGRPDLPLRRQVDQRGDVARVSFHARRQLAALEPPHGDRTILGRRPHLAVHHNERGHRLRVRCHRETRPVRHAAAGHRLGVPAQDVPVGRPDPHLRRRHGDHRRHTHRQLVHLKVKGEDVRRCYLRRKGSRVGRGQRSLLQRLRLLRQLRNRVVRPHRCLSVASPWYRRHCLVLAGLLPDHGGKAAPPKVVGLHRLPRFRLLLRQPVVVPHTARAHHGRAKLSTRRRWRRAGSARRCCTGHHVGRGS
mmetsp:Transcript_4141/g.13469  ORF Transcript_4141/g.13469 Transcript_4141/m.13469 type:complete len:307 (-) Transcript_4141:398-1318(-)